MLHHLESIDLDYLDKINVGLYVPSRLSPKTTVDGKVFIEHLVDKFKSEWAMEDKENVLKDAKVKQHSTKQCGQCFHYIYNLL